MNRQEEVVFEAVDEPQVATVATSVSLAKRSEDLISGLKNAQLDAGILEHFDCTDFLDLVRLIDASPVKEPFRSAARAFKNRGILPFAEFIADAGCFVAIRYDEAVAEQGGNNLALILEDELLSLGGELSRERIHCVLLEQEEFDQLTTAFTSDEERRVLLSQYEVSDEARDRLYGYLNDAAVAGASDVHIEPYGDAYRLRFRLQGSLWVRESVLALETASAFIGVIRSDAGSGLTNPNLPEDASIRIAEEQAKKYPGLRGCNLRISGMPTAREGGRRDVVIRIHSENAKIANLMSLHLGARTTDGLRKLVRAHRGIILVTGPTGSGKTSTLYGTLNEVISDDLKLVTIEDPAEVIYDGMTQTKVHQKYGATFAKMLRNTLRHDPDIILIGEIRDSETAETAIQAALTGHLVFSTVHTNDAVGAVTRLLDLEFSDFLDWLGYFSS